MISALKKIAKRIVARLPIPLQKSIYIAWYNIRNANQNFVRSINTARYAAGTEASAIRLVGFVKVYNEAASGNLERVLNHLKRFCDEIVMCDCGSTDNSIEVAKKFTSHILQEPNDFRRELFTKQRMLEYTLKLNPDWIVWLDADEVFDREGELGGIRKLCAYGNAKGIDGFSFTEYNLWKSTQQYRVDEFWGDVRKVNLWKNNGKLKFETRESLHLPQHPIGLTRIQPVRIKLIHFGFSSPEAIEQKYNMYKEWGQQGYLLERIRDERGIALKAFDIDWLPLSTFSVSIVCLIYRSTGYLDFVYRSFKKYTHDADFLFVANDATEKVKWHLVDNHISHLVFENEDRNEYYLKRVYRAWNYGGFNAPGDIIVFVNSDMAFSFGWLENLLKNVKKDRIVCSRLVESGKMPSGTYGITKNFGRTRSEFNDEAFQAFAQTIKKPELHSGGLFMPCAMYKEVFVKSGGYPIGNRKGPNGSEISGDRIFFYEKLKPMNIEHCTTFDSVVYHIQEGEMDE